MPLNDTLLDDEVSRELVRPARTGRIGSRARTFDLSDDAELQLKEMANSGSRAQSAPAEQAKAEKPLGLMGTIKEGAKGTLRALGATADTMQGDAQGVVTAAQEQAAAPKDPDLERFYAHIEERKQSLGDNPSLWEGIKAVGGAAIDNPRGAALMVAEQLPNSGVALGAGAAGALAGSFAGPVGATVGGLAGLFGANVGLETGHKALEAAQDLDFSPDDRKRVLREGLVKGSVISTVDAGTLGITNFITGTTRRAVQRATLKTLTDHGVDIASDTARRAAMQTPAIAAAVKTSQKLAEEGAKKLGNRLAQAGGAVALETIGEGAGEYLGELAATGKADTVEAVVEAFAGLGTSIGEIATTSALNRRGLKRLLDTPEEAAKTAEDQTKETGVEHEAIKHPTEPDKFVAVPKVRSISGIELERDAEGNLKPVAPVSTQADFNLANRPGFQHTAEDKIRERELARNTIAGRPVADMSNNALIYTVDRGSARAQKIASDELARRENNNVEMAPETPAESVKRIITTGAEKAQEDTKRIIPATTIPTPTIQPEATQQAQSGNRGANLEVVLPDNTSLPAQWDVVDADTVKATIKEGKNQPRDRSRAASDIQVQGIANNPDYRRLEYSPIMDVGAPVLSADGLIVAGNGRFEGVSRSYEQGSANQYLASLKADAAAKGIDPARLEGMKKPVLVRRITQPFDVRKLAIASNSGAGLQYSGLELAKIDAERMQSLENLDITETGDIALTGSNMANIRHSLSGYSAAELGSLVDKDGSLSQEGVRRIRNAMLYSAYGSNPTLERLVESTDNDLRNISGALVRAAGAAAKARAEISAGRLPAELDISEQLVGAVETLSKIRAQGQSVDEYLAQNGLFGEEISEDTKAILRVLEANIRSQKKIADFIRTYYDSVAHIDTSTDDIFGAQPPTKPELLKNAKERITEKQPDTKDLFARPAPESRPESPKQPQDNARPSEGRKEDQQVKKPEPAKAPEPVAKAEPAKPANNTNAKSNEKIKPSSSFDSKAWNEERNQRIKESRDAGNTHLDRVYASVETMRGKKIYSAHDPKERGTIRTVSNHGDIIVHWDDEYSGNKNLAQVKTEKRGRKVVQVLESWLSPSDHKDYVFAKDAPASPTKTEPTKTGTTKKTPPKPQSKPADSKLTAKAEPTKPQPTPETPPLRPHIADLIKRRAAASQTGKDRTVNNAIARAKEVMDGKRTDTALESKWFRAHAATMRKADPGTADILSRISEAIKAQVATPADVVFSRSDESMAGPDLSRRGFLKAAGALTAWAAISPKTVFAAPAPKTLDALLRKGDLKGSLNWIAVNSDIPANRELAKQLLTLLPKNVTLDWATNLIPYGAAMIDRKNGKVDILLRDSPHEGKTGMSEETLLHETIHAAIIARYDLLNYYSANPGKWGKREADEALSTYIKVWNEFRSVAKKEKNHPVWLSEPMNNPDEFITYALTSPPFQAWLKARKYEGQTLWTRFKNAISRMLGTGPAPTWLDAALMASNDVMTAMAKDRADFAISTELGKSFAASKTKAQSALFQKADIRDRITKITDSLIFNFQDRFKPLKDIQKRAGPVPEDADASLAEERYSGMVRARMDTFEEQMRDPLLKAIHDSGVPFEEVEKYLHALHAPSRNAAMREINPTEAELKTQTESLEKQRDSLANDKDVKEYLKERRDLRQAEADIEEGIADESLAVAIKRDIAQLRKNQNVKDYTEALDKLRALRSVKPFQGDNTALSGMSDAEAKAILAKTDANGTQKALERVSSLVDTITSRTRQIFVESGLEKADTIDAWNKKYEHYIPLHRDEVSGNTMPKVGQGFNIRGKESKRATGSNKEVTNILAHVVAQHEAAIIRSEKSKVDRALFQFATTHPDPSLWTLDVAPMLKTVDPTSGLVVERVDPTYKNRDEVLTLKIDGEEHTITFNDQNLEAMRLVSSMKNISSQQLGEVTQLVGKFTRFLATMNTTANPVFVARNFLRDLQTAFVNLSDTEIAAKKKEVFQNIPAAIKGMWNLSRGKGGSQWAKHAQEFKNAGGQTGWMEHYKDIGARADSIKAELAAMQPGKANASRRALKTWWQTVEDANNAVENGARLAAFVAARRSGISEGKAASMAKNLTVNFNARGAKGVELNMWYMFMNASIQGTARLIKAMSNKQVRKIVAGVVLSGFLMDIMARSMAGDDDEDGENDYDQLPEHTKAMNFVFMIDGQPVTLPMPYGYNFFASAGRKISEMMFRENYSAVKSAADLTGIFLDAFSPVGQAGSGLQYVAPTVADPFIQWAENKNFAGNPLRKGQNSFGPPKPEYQMGFKSTSAPAQWLAETLNNETGGNEVRPGYVDVNPAMFDFAVSSILGGMGRTYMQSVSGPIKVAGGDDLQAREIPFLNIFVGARPEHQTERKYFEAAENVERATKEISTYRQKGDVDMVRQIREDRKGELRLAEAAKTTKRILAHLRKSDLALDKTDPPNKQELRKKIEERKREVMARFNKRYREATTAE